MAKTVIGIFDSASEAQNAVEKLVDKGFTRSNIDVSSRTSSESMSSSTSTHKHDDDDSIGGFFRSLFGSDEDSRSKYTNVAQRGSIVTVHAQSSEEAEQAADILDDCGAVDVDERASQYGYSSSAGTDTKMDARTSEGTTSIPIIEENLQVGKRVVESGGARIRSRIIERPVEESLRLREEHVRVERNTVDRPATEADLAAFKEGTIEMTERTEVPVVSKEARVVEEVSLGKEVEEREETIRDTVRRTEVDVENIDNTLDRTSRLDRDVNVDRDVTVDKDLDEDDLRNRPGSL